MRCRKELVASLVFVLLTANFAVSQTNDPGSFTDASVSVVDGSLVLNGKFTKLVGIQALSPAGHLSIETIDIGGQLIDLRAPFPSATGSVVVNTPYESLLGVLGADKTISLEGQTQTAIRYGASEEVATSDLTFNLGVGNCEPVELTMSPTTYVCGGGTVGGGGGGGGTGGGVPRYRIVDGEIRIVGDIQDLASVSITSEGGLLSLAHQKIRNTAPFPNGIVVQDDSHRATLGVLGTANQINIEGETKTSILYSESLETAANGDLTLFVGVNNSVEPKSLPIGASGEFAQGVTILDGAVTLVGSFGRLAGIEARSEGEFLSIDTTALTFTNLFSAGGTNVTTLEDGEITIAAADASFRLSSTGEIGTGIFFSGDADAIAFSDLVVSIGLGDAAPISVPFADALVPEPSSAFPFLLAFLSLLVLRRNRTVSFL